MVIMMIKMILMIMMIMWRWRWTWKWCWRWENVILALGWNTLKLVCNFGKYCCTVPVVVRSGQLRIPEPSSAQGPTFQSVCCEWIPCTLVLRQTSTYSTTTIKIHHPPWLLNSCNMLSELTKKWATTRAHETHVQVAISFYWAHSNTNESERARSLLIGPVCKKKVMLDQASEVNPPILFLRSKHQSDFVWFCGACRATAKA